jgi:hypothetical protein
MKSIAKMASSINIFLCSPYDEMVSDELDDQETSNLQYTNIGYNKVMHTCNRWILERCRPTRLRPLEQKTYKTNVVRNGEVKLLLKRNFKESTICD